MKGKIIEMIQVGKSKSFVMASTVGGSVLGLAGRSFAAEGDPAVDTTQVTSTFSSMSTTVLTVIGAVAATAVTIMGVILAWKYGKKLFGMLAK